MTEADHSFSLRAVSVLIGQRHKWVGLFPSVTGTEGESETARSERLFMIFLDYKKISGWIFTIIG